MYHSEDQKILTAMINMGTDSRPFWGYIRERNPVENEVVLKSENDNTKEDMRNIHFYTSKFSYSKFNAK